MDKSNPVPSYVSRYHRPCWAWLANELMHSFPLRQFCSVLDGLRGLEGWPMHYAYIHNSLAYLYAVASVLGLCRCLKWCPEHGGTVGMN